MGWCEADYPLGEVPPAEPDDVDRRIGELVAERIPDGATIQTGIGAIPNAILANLRNHRDLGVHTELLSDGLVDLVESGVVNGVRKQLNRTKVVGTFALGHQAALRLPGRQHRHRAVARALREQPAHHRRRAELRVDQRHARRRLPRPVRLGDDRQPRTGRRRGGQSDFARGAMFSPGGQGFIVVRSTAKQGEVSAITPQLPTGSAVTTMKNTVDKVVTEHGVAELRGRTIAERTEALIGIAHPGFRERLRDDARRLGYLH